VSPAVALYIDKLVLPSLRFKLAASVLISKIDNLQLSRVDIEHGPDKDIFELYACELTAFEEDAFIFDVVLDGERSTISIVLSLRK
jgi:hypothetical protein